MPNSYAVYCVLLQWASRVGERGLLKLEDFRPFDKKLLQKYASCLHLVSPSFPLSACNNLTPAQLIFIELEIAVFG